MPNPLSKLLIPVFPNVHVFGWPTHELGGRAVYTPIERTLTRRYEHDAHVSQYFLPTIERRLTVTLVRDPSHADKIPDGVRMLVVLFDVDCQLSHKSSGATSPAPASDEWWLAELPKLHTLMDEHASPFIYRTRHGYRILFVLAVPLVIRNASDDAAWTRNYLRWIAYLRRRYDIIADPTCNDWVRLFRVPHATRNGSDKPEEHATLGDPDVIGAWVCQPSAEDIALALTLTKKKVARERRANSPQSHRDPPSTTERDPRISVLGLAFEKLGWLGPLNGAGKRCARCPRVELHSDGRGAGRDDSTVLFAATGQSTIGGFACAHQHCVDLDWKAVLADPRVKQVRREAELALARLLRREERS
jgi:hypothetical protein